MPLSHKQILIIDDSASIRTFLRISLQAQHATLYEAPSATQGLELCDQKRPDLIVLDLGLPDRDGLSILPELKRMKTQEGKEPVVVILSVRKEQHIKDRAISLGADAYITKPFMMEELIEVFEQKLHVRVH